MRRFTRHLLILAILAVITALSYWLIVRSRMVIDLQSVVQFGFNDQGYLAVTSGINRHLYIATPAQIDAFLPPIPSHTGFSNIFLFSNGRETYFCEGNSAELYVVDGNSTAGYRLFHTAFKPFNAGPKITDNIDVEFAQDSQELPFLIVPMINPETGASDLTRVQVLDQAGGISFDVVLDKMFATRMVVVDNEAQMIFFSSPDYSSENGIHSIRSLDMSTREYGEYHDANVASAPNIILSAGNLICNGGSKGLMSLKYDLSLNWHKDFAGYLGNPKLADNTIVHECRDRKLRGFDMNGNEQFTVPINRSIQQFLQVDKRMVLIEMDIVTGKTIDSGNQNLAELDLSTGGIKRFGRLPTNFRSVFGPGKVHNGRLYYVGAGGKLVSAPLP